MTKTRRLFIYSSDFIRVICKTNAELRRLRLTTYVPSLRYV